MCSQLPQQQNKSKGQRGEVVDVVKGFIGLAGPYDIADHYVFESERVVGPFRGVHEISPMKPAILGIENFKVHSPTALAAECKLSKLPKFHILHGVDDTVRQGSRLRGCLAYVMYQYSCWCVRLTVRCSVLYKW